MKRYLLARRKLSTKSNPTKTSSYPPGHILLLPHEILEAVFASFASDVHQLLQLALVCSKFNEIVCQSFIYRDVKLKVTGGNFYKFYNAHMPPISLTKKFTVPLRGNSLSNSTSFSNCIHSLMVENPVKYTNPYSKSKIAGTYEIESTERRSQDTDYELFVKAFTNVLHECPLLDCLILSEILPNFAFPPCPLESLTSSSSFVFFLGFKREKPKRYLKKLILRAQSGWSIPFKIELLSSVLTIFEKIGELELHNFIIDESKIFPSSLAHLSKHFLIEKLTLVSCTYINKPRKSPREPSPLFKSTSHLSLLKIHSGSDLSAIDFIKSNNILSKLTIDLSSLIFFEKVLDEKKFNFKRYNLFFKLLCSGSGSYGTITELELVKLDMVDEYGELHYIGQVEEEHDVDDWVAPSNDTFKAFLSFIAPMKKIVMNLRFRKQESKQLQNGASIMTCETQSNKLQMWNNIFKPLLETNPYCSLRVVDSELRVLFSREGNASTKM